MEQKAIKALFVNGGPRKNKNTAQMLMSAMKGARDDWKYPTLLGSCADQLRENFGHSETLYVCNTYQFNDYSRYAMTVFKEADKRKYRDEHFPQDLENAYKLGNRLIGNCRMG